MRHNVDIKHFPNNCFGSESTDKGGKRTMIYGQSLQNLSQSIHSQ